jgi:hypothetical protein
MSLLREDGGPVGMNQLRMVLSVGVRTFGGRFAMRTMRVCSTALEKRGPTGVQSVQQHTHIV